MTGKLKFDEQAWLKVFNSPDNTISKCLTPSFTSRGLENTLRVYEEKTDEQNSVQDLNIWERTVSNFEAVNVIKEAKELLKRRIKHQNDIEQTISGRKLISGSRSNASSPVLRTVPKEKMQGFKEISLFNKQFEQDMLKSYNKYLEKLEELTKERETLRFEVSGLREELTKTQAEIENCKFSLKVLEKNKGKLKVVNNAAGYFTRKASLREEVFKNESKCVELMREVERKITKNKKIIESLDTKCAHIRKELSYFKEALLEHFKTLLKEGKDSRSEGLQWIVKEIWKLGESLNKSDFAAFLNDEIIESILKLAEKNRELDELTGRDAKKASSRGMSLPSSQEKMQEVHVRLAEISKKLRIKKEVWIFNDRKSVIAWENCSPVAETKTFYSSTKGFDIQNKVKEIKDQIERLQDETVQRVFKLCYYTGYQHKKRVELNLLVSTVIGIDNIDKYNSAIIRMKRELDDKLAQTRTFKFSGHREKPAFV